MTYRNTVEQESEARMMRGMQMLQNGATITENVDGSFSVPSQTSSKTYEVRILGDRMVCTCPDFEYRQIEACKHINLVIICLGMRYLKDEPKAKVFADDAIPCDRCGSIRVIRYGISAGKQVFKCKDCQHKFREPSLLKKARFSPKLVTLTLDLYFSGLSLRKIARNLKDHFEIDVHYSTIYDWIAKYVPLISEYVNTLSPQLSETWHTDELFVRMHGSTLQGKYKGLAFVWNVMDRETRFLLASRISEGRDAQAAIAAFQQAIKNAHGQLPKQVLTDALPAYKEGVRTVFAEQATHIHKCGIKKPHGNNNRIERLNGTLRERVKVQRGWKSYQTPLAEGKRIQYNFVKPHMALEGKTPAQRAGLTTKGWKDLLTLAMQGNSNV